MLDITLNGISITSDATVYQKGKGIIVDSGTTDTYLPKSVASGFSKAWEAVTGSVRNAASASWYAPVSPLGLGLLFSAVPDEGLCSLPLWGHFVLLAIRVTVRFLCCAPMKWSWLLRLEVRTRYASSVPLLTPLK